MIHDHRHRELFTESASSLLRPHTKGGHCNALIYIAIETKIVYCDCDNKVDVASCLEYQVDVVTSW